MIHLNTSDIDQSDYTIAANQLWQKLQDYLHYLSDAEHETIELAFWQMVEAHGDQRRKSGEFYSTHPVSACVYLTQLQIDISTLCACLLHDVPEDTDVTLEDLKEHFSEEIIYLVFGVTKFSRVKYQGEQRYAENLRKMFVAMSKDIRVIFIKLADRLHNLQSLDALPPHKAHRIALESLDIYAPISARLGMSSFLGEIQDAAFPHVFPDEYKEILSYSNIEIEKRTMRINQIIARVATIFKDHQLGHAKTEGRAKKYYSIYKKIKLKKKHISQIYDLIALRIIVDSIDECYQVLSLIHQFFDPVPNRIKDYIQKPKPNGYKSIHTTVYDTETGTTFEVQIRTQLMHEFSEYGIASHWSYKTKNATQFLDSADLKWVKELVELGNTHKDQKEYLEYVKLDLFEDEIFVMTPKLDVISLPEGSCPLDFAFKIHNDIGAHASMAKVNGKPVKLNTELRNGDIVEIITQKSCKPKQDWLQWVKRRDTARTIKYLLRKSD